MLLFQQKVHKLLPAPKRHTGKVVMACCLRDSSMCDSPMCVRSHSAAHKGCILEQKIPTVGTDPCPVQRGSEYERLFFAEHKNLESVDASMPSFGTGYYTRIDFGKGEESRPLT